jgi:hypothetical protein
MQSTQDTLSGARMIFLDEFVRKTHGLELIGSKGFHEESTVIRKNLGNQYNNLSEVS